MNIQYNTRCRHLRISQTRYIDEVVARLNQIDSKDVSSPMDSSCKISKPTTVSDKQT